MNKYFMTFLGTAIICATIGTVTNASGKPIPSTIFYTIAGISVVVAILLLANPNFFKTLNKHAVTWLLLALGFGILAFHLKTLGAEYQATTLICATISTISIISAIGHGFYPNNRRAGSLLIITFNLVFYIPITWMVLGGLNGTLEMFKAPTIADQMANVIPQEIGVIDALIKIPISIFKGQPVKINGVLPFPHLLLIIHLAWNFFKFMHSYGWIFILSSFTMPFIIVAWIKYVPKTPCFESYLAAFFTAPFLMGITLSLKKHWRTPQTT